MPYVFRKNIVMTGATASMSPAQITATATRPVSNTAARGSVGLPIRPAIQRGTTRSEATASSVRGAASTLPSALDSVLAATPARIRMGTAASSDMAAVLETNSSAVKWVANQTAAAT